jgi:lysophospholipase L1-like esterase
MLTLLILIIIFLTLIMIVVVYSNYISHYSRIHIYGRKPVSSSRYTGIIPVFNLKDQLYGKTEKTLLQLLLKRKLPLVVCLGDSITHGIVSTNYVDALQKKYKDSLLFINSGINGNLAYNLNKRLQGDCIDFDPDYVTILIGTNDVNCHKSLIMMKRYIKMQRLPQYPDREFFKNNLVDILESIKKKTKAETAVLSLPVIGENLESIMNQKVKEYSDIIKEMTKRYKVSYLPLYETQKRFLEEIKERNPSVYMKKHVLIILSLMINRSFDKIAEINGNYLTYDGLHETSRGAAMIEELISGFLEKEMQTALNGKSVLVNA